ncbi:hypothetical protein RFI_18561 [Reticulomyxa filosa]|uniref:G protein-coupled receptor kinase n=1 Tax=Reticulomyxa filosa TaxID=46433 RepID=X6MXX0_RETFI|nr:hypothetical protein RFI_18561 [Reticulomyxa filosa]|eukprot:ETO18691.1 hypothetical protein RFI_18561 [Reticulomyxa filosa]
MYDDIIHLAMDQQLLTEIRERDAANYKKMPFWKELQNSANTSQLEQKLMSEKQLTFEKIFFKEPVGYHLMKSFLINEHSVDKAVFLSDVEVFKTLQDPRAREQVASKIFSRFCAPQKEEDIWNIDSRNQGLSVFEKIEDVNGKEGKGDDIKQKKKKKFVEHRIEEQQHHEEKDTDPLKYRMSLLTENTNNIGVYGRPIERLKKRIEEEAIVNKEIFNEVAEEVINDLRLDVFPRFVKSRWYQMYLRCQAYIEEKSQTVTIRDFYQMRMLGRGAFGVVNACKKKDTGKLYAMKQINKKRVQGTDSIEAIMSERNFLADIGIGANDCRFVTSLKYAFMDESTLYLVLDLMIGGDLKYHLNHEKVFNEERSRFYAAQVLLGLEHIHNKHIVYRDLKLENVLMDDKGNIKLSDLGLAVRMRDERGEKKRFVDTPAHLEGMRGGGARFFFPSTSPKKKKKMWFILECRFLCGKKPFQSVRRNRAREPQKDDKQRNQTAELDRNVVEMEPSFPLEYFSANARSLVKGLLCKNPRKRLGANGIHEIKQHPWFDSADFGLLEAGYLDPPFIPSLDEIHAEGQQSIGRPPQDDMFNKLRITPEFEKSLEGFTYINKVIIQEEIVEVLKKVNSLEGKRQGHHQDNTAGDLPPYIDNALQPNGERQSCMARCLVV